MPGVTEVRRGCQIAWDGVTDHCERPSKCWELKGPLKEQLMFTTIKLYFLAPVFLVFKGATLEILSSYCKQNTLKIKCWYKHNSRCH